MIENKDNRHHTHHNHDSVSNIKFAFFLNVGFTLLEIAGGLFTNSLAILSDALHDLGDSFSLALSWYFEKLSKKGKSKTLTYGYKRYSLLGALISSIILVIGSVIILSEALPRILDPEPVNVGGMIILAIIGIGVNGLAVFRLKKGDKISEKVVMLHLLEDVLGWVAVLIAGIIMMFKNIPVMDPVLSVVITMYVLWKAFGNTKVIIKIFLQLVPGNIDIDEVEKTVISIDKVKKVHDTHIWSLDGDYNVLTLHVVIEDNVKYGEVNSIKHKIKEEMKKLNIEHVTIEVERESEECDVNGIC